MSENYNPIRSVNGMPVKCPDAYSWKLEDISSSDAGRTESTVMDKKRIGQIVGIELSWQWLTTLEISKILKAFNPEYISVCYLDPMEGEYVTAEFYVGNRSAPLYDLSQGGLWSNLAFNLIKRSGV